MKNIMVAKIIIEYGNTKEVYYTSNSASKVQDKFNDIRKELIKLKTHFIRNLTTIMETYNSSTNMNVLYYISMSKK